MQYISQLSNELWNLCPAPLAETEDEAKDWYYKPENHLKKFIELVRPLPASMNPVIKEAIKEWQKIESDFFSDLKVSKVDFIDEFKKNRDSFFSRKTDWQTGIYKYGLLCEGVVLNIEWINVFAWQLPAVDPKNSERYYEMAQVMISIMYLEIFVKYAREADPDKLNEPLKNIEARYKIVFDRTIPIKNRIIKSINTVIQQFQSNPYEYLRESDIQCALFTELRKNIPEKIMVPRKIGNGQDFELNLIYTEYLYKNLSNRIDIVCLDSTRIKEEHLETFKNLNTYIYNLPVLVGIELKCCTMGYKKDFNYCNDDYQKLSKFEDIYNKLAIYFLQDDEGIDKLYEEMKNDNGEVKLISQIDHIDGKYVITPNEIWMSV